MQDIRPKVMTESEATDPKGKYFKALIAAPDPLKKQPRKPTTRSLVTMQQRQRRLSKGHSMIPKGDAVPIGETAPTGGKHSTGTISEAAPATATSGGEELLTETRGVQGLEAVCTASGCPDRVGDDVRNLSKLLFEENFTGFIEKSEKLEDDMAVIQTIFNANERPKLVAEDTVCTPIQTQPTFNANERPKLVAEDTVCTPIQTQPTSNTEPVLTGGSQPGLVCSSQSNPTQFNQTTDHQRVPYTPLAGTGKHRVFLRLAKVDNREEPRKNAARAERRSLRHRKPVGTLMRLPKISSLPSAMLPGEARKVDASWREGGPSSEIICCGTTNLNRSRTRGVSKSSGSTQRNAETCPSISYPCPSNPTVIQQRGCHTSTRASSPMPLPRKPLPPIRRRHHSDICTVCPQVQDWKGFARNSRWYLNQSGEQCSCGQENGSINHRGEKAEASEKQVSNKEKLGEESLKEELGEERREDLGGKRDEEETDAEDTGKETRSNDDRSDSWYPDNSIPVEGFNNLPLTETSSAGKAQDQDPTQVSTGCEAVWTAHCPWLDEAQQNDDEDTSKEPKPKTGQQNEDTLQAMAFECENKTECDFEDDSTLLRAVLLRNHALNHGVLSESGDLESSAVKGHNDEKLDECSEFTNSKQGRNSDDCNVLLNFCNRLLKDGAGSEKVSKPTHLLQVHRQGSDLTMTPKAAVIMTSRGQQKLVNSSLVAVGRGHTESQTKTVDRERTSTSDVADFGVREESDEALLRQEMKRYLHSLRHDNAKKQHRPHGQSSALNISLRVQNLTAARPITAEVTNNSRLTEQVTKAVGFIPILTKEEYGSLCKKNGSPNSHRFHKSPAILPPISGHPNEMLLIKRFNGEVKGMQLPRRQDRNNKK